MYFSDSLRTRDICDGFILITEMPFARFDVEESSSSLIFCGRCLALPDGLGAVSASLLLEFSRVAHESRLETPGGSKLNPSSSSFMRSPQSAVFCGVDTSAFSGDLISGEASFRSAGGGVFSFSTFLLSSALLRGFCCF